MPESHLAGNELELPHPADSFVIESCDPIPALQEATVPVLERLGIVQAQNLDVGREQSRLLNRRHDLRQRRNIGPWEDCLTRARQLALRLVFGQSRRIKLVGPM
jgi:hypothetical protein